MGRKKAVKNTAKVKNGMTEALGMGSFNNFGLPQMGGFPGTEPVSNAGSMFKNLRWYLVSNFRQVLTEMYVELGLIQTIVDVPVDDALRGGIEIKSGQLDEDQILELVTAIDRDDDLHMLGQAAKWTRLYGGGGVIVMTDQDPEEPLDIDAITKDTPVEFRAVDLWELFWSQQNTDTLESLDHADSVQTFDFHGKKVHKSRVMQMKGIAAPSFIRPRLRGWGMSVVEVLIRSINQYLKATDLSYEVLDEFKLDVYKMKNLINTLALPNGSQKIKERVQLSNWQKNYQNAIVMDSEDDFDHKQLSFAGLAEAMAGIRMQVASDLRMPITKLFGQSVSGGIGNNDQNDIENYNSMVESQVRRPLKKPILQLCEIKCQQLFGMVPDDLSVSFKPLRVLSAEQEEHVKDSKHARLLAAKERGEITTHEYREACNKGNLHDITLDTSGDQLNPDDPEIEDVIAGKEAEAIEGIDGDEEQGEENEKNEKVANAEFDGSKHPRADDGKFGSGGGSGGKDSIGKSVKAISKGLGLHVTKAPSGKFVYAGRIPSGLGLSKADGSPLSAAEAKEYSESSNPGMLKKVRGYKTPSFDTAEEAEAFAKEKGHKTEAAEAAKAKPEAKNITAYKEKDCSVSIQQIGDKFISKVVFPDGDYMTSDPESSVLGAASFATALTKDRKEPAQETTDKLPEGNSLPKNFFKKDLTSEDMAELSIRTAFLRGKRPEGVKPSFSKNCFVTLGTKKIYSVLSGIPGNGPNKFATKQEAEEWAKVRNRTVQEDDEPQTFRVSWVDPKKKNDIAPYTRIERIDRVLRNSTAFDIASYEADGGDSWIDPRRAEMLSMMTMENGPLWERAKEASQKAFGEIKYPFVAWFYKKQGGKF